MIKETKVIVNVIQQYMEFSIMRPLRFLITYKTGTLTGTLLGLLAVFISDHTQLCELWLSFQERTGSLCDFYDSPISLVFFPLMLIEIVLALFLSALPTSDMFIANIFAAGAPWLRLAASVIIFAAIGVSIQYLVRKRHTPSIKQN